MRPLNLGVYLHSNVGVPLRLVASTCLSRLVYSVPLLATTLVILTKRFIAPRLLGGGER